MQKGTILELEIEKLIYEGKALARAPDGRVIFLEGALPHERVRARIEKAKSDFMVAMVLETLTNSPERVSPRCPHFKDCGGCSLQHASYGLQLECKKDFLAEALSKIGKIEPNELEKCLPSPLIWNYRNKMEFTFSFEGKIRLGLHPRGSFRRTIDLEECPISSFPVEGLFPLVHSWAEEFGLSVWDLREHKGSLRHLVVRRSQNTGELLLNLVCGEEITVPAKEAFSALFKEATVIFTLNRAWGDSHHIDRQEVLSGKGFITEKIGNLRFRISPSSFFQTNTLQAEALYKTVKDFTRRIKPRKILDIYCGTGTIACFLAEEAEEVWGVEKMAEAVSDAQANASLNGLKNLYFVQEEAEKTGPLSGYDLVVLDPPRSGLHPRTKEALSDSRVPYIVYISCNPSTLARDLEGLDNYRVLKATPFDFFPHTFHVETCTVLEAIS